MPRFDDILSPNTEVEIQITGRSGEPVPIKITANPNAMTGSVHEKLVTGKGSLEMQKNFFDLALDLIVDWDLTDNDGEKLPITRETLTRFPTDKIDTIVEQVQDALRPKATKKRTSDAS